MKFNYEKVAITLLTLLSLLFVVVGTVHANEILFGVYTSDKPTVMYQKFSPILNYLQHYLESKEIRVKIKIKIYSSYSGAIDAMVNGDIDFARFGPASYILAQERNKGIRLLCMEHKKGKKRFNGVFIARQDDTSISTLQNVKGKSFAFGDKNSTIGRYLSQAELVEANIMATDLKEYVYLGRHDKVAFSVAAGKYDVGVIKENTYKKYQKNKGLKKIGEFPNVTKPWVVRAEFDDKLYNLLRDAMLSIEDKSILNTLKQNGFLPATDKEYDFVRQGMKVSQGF